jgi:hypothetical protein
MYKPQQCGGLGPILGVVLQKREAWRRIFLEMLTNISSAGKKFPSFNINRRFVTVFTSATHLSLSWARSNPSTHVFPTGF